MVGGRECVFVTSLLLRRDVVKTAFVQLRNYVMETKKSKTAGDKERVLLKQQI